MEQNVLGEVCSAYRDLFPKSAIEPESGDTEELLTSLRAGEIDAALVTLPLQPDGYKASRFQKLRAISRIVNESSV
jgi:DNA-binding transcriptional LysR family regulator